MSRATSHIDRRALIRSYTTAAAVLAGTATALAGGTAVNFSAIAAARPSEPDPIFALITQHRVAYEAHGVAVLATAAAPFGSVEEEMAERRQDAACRADCDALRALVLTVPSTFAGAAAMLRYLIEYQHLGNSLRPISDDLIGTMLRFAEART